MYREVEKILSEIKGISLDKLNEILKDLNFNVNATANSVLSAKQAIALYDWCSKNNFVVEEIQSEQVKKQERETTDNCSHPNYNFTPLTDLQRAVLEHNAAIRKELYRKKQKSDDYSDELNIGRRHYLENTGQHSGLNTSIKHSEYDHNAPVVYNRPARVYSIPMGGQNKRK